MGKEVVLQRIKEESAVDKMKGEILAICSRSMSVKREEEIGEWGSNERKQHCQALIFFSYTCKKEYNLYMSNSKICK